MRLYDSTGASAAARRDNANANTPPAVTCETACLLEAPKPRKNQSR